MTDRLANHAVSFGTSGARGLVSAFTDAYCRTFTQALLQVVGGNIATLLIGHDLRPSSPAIAAACMAAAEDAGVAVRFAGAVPTPALALASRDMRVAAILVTGSHIPADRNGLKAYTPRGELTKADEQAMLNTVVDDPPRLSRKPARREDPGILRRYVARCTGAFPPGALNGMRIGVYEHSTVARDMLHDVLRSLGAETIALGRSDAFIALDTEALRQEDHDRAAEWAGLHRFDAIVSADGDADRPLLGDERGRWLRGDVLGILAAKALGAATVVTPVSSSTALERSGLFANIIRTRIGSPHVIAAMEQARGGGSVVGFEANGGVLLGSDIAMGGLPLTALPTRDAMLPILLVLTAAWRKRIKVSEMARSLPQRFTHSDRLKDMPAARSHALLAALEADRDGLRGLLGGKCGCAVAVDRTDGLRVTFETGDIVHLRPSGNAPELRCYTEAGSPSSAQALCRTTLENARIALACLNGDRQR